ncbi:S49 family peptidase [Occultella glacieicola]|uniref:S49 family peptidase n=1 Tax=Occultella glacieicola TaxID=2518684 RepID=A0ABY2EDM5_9MICO|nr:S49 family peptidase [Occultella glacieicola]TDE99007.1 S49 family peptidase [Occultella glacieicola]
MRALPTPLAPLLGRRPGPDTEPDRVIVDLSGPYPAQRRPGLAALLQRTSSLDSLAERLDRIGEADWVKSVVVRVRGLTADLATAGAIAGLLAHLAERKHVVAYLEQVSMTGLLATAPVPDVVAPESADVSVPGLAGEQIYLGAFLRGHGIGFENLRIGEYKSALTPFSQDHMDDAQREQLGAYLDSAESSWVHALAAGRGVSEDAARGWLDAGLTSAAELLEVGLITRIAYDDELVTVADTSLARTLDLLRRQHTGAGRRTPLRVRPDGVAVVPVVGAIVSGSSGGGPPVPVLGGPRAGSDTVVAALRRADRDEHTKAIVLFVDSGGGSALASDVIHRAVVACRKPVVAVMGSVAGSGGYYVLAGADHVLASPFTLTGSIGVVIGKPVLTEFSDRHGFNAEPVGREDALALSTARPFTDAQRERMTKLMGEVYARFVDRVATGRGLTPARVDELGRGRIWSGRDAVGLGLVDALGDLRDGLAYARRLAGLPADAPARPVRTGLTVPGLPTLGTDPAAALEALWPFGTEHVLAWMDPVRIR